MAICSAPQKDFDIFIFDGEKDIEVPFDVEQNIKTIFCDSPIDANICTNVLFPTIFAQFLTGVGVGNSLILHVEKQPRVTSGVGVGGTFVLKKDHLRQASAGVGVNMDVILKKDHLRKASAGISLGAEVTVKVGSKDVAVNSGISPRINVLVSHGIVDIVFSAGIGSDFDQDARIYVDAYLSDINDKHMQEIYVDGMRDLYVKEKY